MAHNVNSLIALLNIKIDLSLGCLAAKLQEGMSYLQGTLVWLVRDYTHCHWNIPTVPRATSIKQHSCCKGHILFKIHQAGTALVIFMKICIVVDWEVLTAPNTNWTSGLGEVWGIHAPDFEIFDQNGPE